MLLDSRCSWPDLLFFGLGFVGADEDDDSNVVGSDASLSLVKSDSDGALLTSTKRTSLWVLSVPPISARRRRTCWRTIFVCGVRFRKSSQNHGHRNIDTSGGLEDPDSRSDLRLMRGSLP